MSDRPAHPTWVITGLCGVPGDEHDAAVTAAARGLIPLRTPHHTATVLARYAPLAAAVTLFCCRLQAGTQARSRSRSRRANYLEHPARHALEQVS